VNEQRKGEIALAIQRYLFKHGRPTGYFAPETNFPDELKRLLEDVSQAIDVPKGELVEFMTSLINEVNEDQ